MSLTNTANKINELCGKIKNIGTYISVDLVEDFLKNKDITFDEFLNDSSIIISTNTVFLQKNVLLEFVDNNKRNIGLSENKNIIIQSSGIYSYNFSYSFITPTEGLAIILFVNGIIRSFVSFERNTFLNKSLSGYLSLKKGDIINLYITTTDNVEDVELNNTYYLNFILEKL